MSNGDKGEHEFKDRPGSFGFLTETVRKLFQFAKWLSPMRWLALVSDQFRARSELEPTEVLNRQFADRRARAIEKYVLSCLLLELLIAIASCLFRWPSIVGIVLTAILSSRVIEIIQVTVNATLFDALTTKADRGVGTVSRILVLAGINFVELLLCFGAIYASNYERLMGAGRPLTGFYFSIITQLTIGYGDVYPTGWLRVVAAIQGLVGALFIILIFGRIVTSLQPIRGLYEHADRQDGRADD